MPFRLVGLDTFEGAYYSLDGEYDDEQAALVEARKRLDDLERTQPSVTSDGQYGGIQDRVFVERPDGSRFRVFPASRR